MKSGDLEQLSDKNKRAWDQLYGCTEGVIWGERVVGFLENFRDNVESGLDRVEGKKQILDAAGGEGRNLPWLLSLRPENTQVTLCDASKAALEKMTRRYADAVQSVSCALDQTGFEDGRFHFILLSDVAETLPDIAGVLREMYRILSSGGRLLCNVPDETDGIAGIDMKEIEKGKYLYRGQYFYQFLERKDFLKMVEEIGFRLVEDAVVEWEEDTHPEFREGKHWHRSPVYLLEKSL